VVDGVRNGEERGGQADQDDECRYKEADGSGLVLEERPDDLFAKIVIHFLSALKKSSYLGQLHFRPTGMGVLEEL
jgi:hypothetical protein